MKRAEEFKVASVVGHRAGRSVVGKWHREKVKYRGTHTLSRSMCAAYKKARSSVICDVVRVHVRRGGRERNSFLEFDATRRGKRPFTRPPFASSGYESGKVGQKSQLHGGARGTRRTSNYLRSFRVATSLRSVSRVFRAWKNFKKYHVAVSDRTGFRDTARQILREGTRTLDENYSKLHASNYTFQSRETKSRDAIFLKVVKL